MDTCSYCGHELRPQARFCPGCGKERVRARTFATPGAESRQNGVPATSPLALGDGGSPGLSFLKQMSDSIRLPEKKAIPPDALPPEKIAAPISPFPEDTTIPETPPNEVIAPISPFPEDTAIPETPPDEVIAPISPDTEGAAMPETPPIAEIVAPVPSALSLPEEQIATAEDEAQQLTPPETSTIPSPYEPVLVALEHLFRFLDKDKETENCQNIENIRQNKLNESLLSWMFKMCLLISRRVIEVYREGQTERYLSHEELLFARLLTDHAVVRGAEELQVAADHSASKNVVDRYNNAKKHWCVLYALCRMQSADALPSDIVRRASAQFREEQPGSPVVKVLWREIAEIVASHLKEQRRANNLTPEIARQWVKAFNVIETVDEETYKIVVDAAQQHVPEVINPLSFLTKAEMTELLGHMRNLHFRQIGRLLRPKQTELFLAFSKALFDPGFRQVLPPRRSIPLVIKDVELIPWIKELLARKDERAPGQALNWLEWAHDGYVAPEHAPVLREWLLYVKARANGLRSVYEDWQADIDQGVASWEEIWNLAVAFHEINIARSLQALIPGIKSQHAPFSHLRFALFCAITMLQQKAKYQGSMALAEDFLLDNLLKLPVPLSYLIWLLLANDAPEAIDSTQQLSQFKVFQDLLDHSITYKRPAHPAREISIEDFERDFQGLLTMAQKLERDYVLEPPQKSITIKSKTLGTSIRVSYDTSARVGIFVDYENLIFSLPGEMKQQPEMIATTLLEYAGTYGDVVTRCICYSPANINKIPNVKLPDIQREFQNAGFKIEVPRDVDGNMKIRENQSDSVLLECITEAMIESTLDVYIIVSGDYIYYERVRRLLEQGYTVSMVSYTGPSKKLSDKYRLLQDKKAYMLEEPGEFIIGKIEKIFDLNDEQIKTLDAEIEERHRDKSIKM